MIAEFAELVDENQIFTRCVASRVSKHFLLVITSLWRQRADERLGDLSRQEGHLARKITGCWFVGWTGALHVL